MISSLCGLDIYKEIYGKGIIGTCWTFVRRFTVKLIFRFGVYQCDIMSVRTGHL